MAKNPKDPCDAGDAAPPFIVPDLKHACVREDILVLLRALTLHSLSQGHFPIALKALELWGKEEGLFMGKSAPAFKPLSQMSEEELKALLDACS